MERYHHPYDQHQHQMMGGSGGGEALVGDRDRFPQWSGPETKEFLSVRAELDRAFMETKRNKALWEVMAARLKEKGFSRSAEQCKSKWKNLVTRYKGCETMEPEAMRQQFPYYNELHAIFSARLHQMLWAEAEGSGVATSGGPTSSTTTRGKGKAVVTTSEQMSSDDDDVEEREYEYEDDYVEKGKNVGTRKGGGRKKKKKKAKGDEGDHYEGELAEVLQGFMREHEKMEARWREAYEAREEERRRREETWRKTMEGLEEERRRMERSWREREEQRRVREEARAIQRDALITHLLNRLRRDDNI